MDAPPSTPHLSFPLAYKQSGWGEDENLSAQGFQYPIHGAQDSPQWNNQLLSSLCLAWGQLGDGSCEVGEPQSNLCEGGFIVIWACPPPS